jgi:glucose/mannose transport system substrate-binding protein
MTEARYHQQLPEKRVQMNISKQSRNCEEEGEETMQFQKQNYLLLILTLIIALVLAGCGGAAPPPAAEEAAEAPAEEAAEAPAEEAAEAPAEEAAGGATGQLEVFSWWTSGGEAAALDELFNAFSAANPDAEIINATIAGGGGSAARAVLQTRLAGGDPPDTWQVHPGFELIGQYVDADFVAPVTDLYESEGWMDVTPKALVDLMSKDGEVYQVTVGVHRGNGLWYNKKLLEENGITVGDTMSMDEFFAAAETLQAAGVTPLCVGDSGIWTNAQLFENTLVGAIGPEAYNGLWNGSVSFDSPEVKAAMEQYGQMLDYINDDHAALSWDQAVGALIEGRCAFNSMGDWAYGEFVNAGLEDNVDFGWVSHPGSDGSFVIVADGFVLGNGAPNELATKNWLRAIGSKEAQEAFNPLKGSICARTDCDRAKFGPYHNWSMDSFSQGSLVPSVVHGSAAPASFQQALNDAVTSFVVDRDVDAFASGLASAASQEEAMQGGGGAELSAAPAESAANLTPEGAADSQLEVFSWWTSGGEAAALDELFNAFSAANPDAEIINATIAGGGGSAARAVLQTRLAGGDPPDTWQVHPGFELIGQYVDADFVAPVTDLYEEQGWYDVTPKALTDLMTKDGEVYQVTVGVHRGNGLWYNKKLLEENGITVGDTMSTDEFFAAAETLQAAGVTPLCVGDSGIWTNAQLFENTLVGVIGPEAYDGLWDGSVSFDSPEVKEAMTIYGQMLDYINNDHAALSWDQAVGALIEGRCAFNSMGDWAYGEFVNAGLEDNVDFGWVSHPGSDGSFVIVADGFVLGNGAPNELATKNWLRAIGSKEAQEAFNPLKGSICARTDCDRAKFGPYHNWSMDSFSQGSLVPSVVHGSAAPADFQQALNDAVTSFVVDRDVDAFASALASGAQMSGFAQ